MFSQKTQQSLHGIRINKRCAKKLAAAPVSISAFVFKVLNCTGILINWDMLEIIGKVYTGVVVNKPIVAVVASPVGSCGIL
jgi:hypothetical protein